MADRLLIWQHGAQFLIPTLPLYIKISLYINKLLLICRQFGARINSHNAAFFPLQRVAIVPICIARPATSMKKEEHLMTKTEYTHPGMTAAELENRVRELLAEAEAAIAAGKKAATNSMHMERGVWVRDDKHVRTRNACRG